MYKVTLFFFVCSSTVTNQSKEIITFFSLPFEIFFQSKYTKSFFYVPFEKVKDKWRSIYATKWKCGCSIWEYSANKLLKVWISIPEKIWQRQATRIKVLKKYKRKGVQYCGSDCPSLKHVFKSSKVTGTIFVVKCTSNK